MINGPPRYVLIYFDIILIAIKSPAAYIISRIVSPPPPRDRLFVVFESPKFGLFIVLFVAYPA